MPSISKDDLFRAILAMDVYHRNYNQGIKPEYFSSQAQIGTATIARNSSNDGLIGGVDHKSIGFFAQEYTWNGKTIIAYRGTDSGFDDFSETGDVLNGYGIAAGRPDGPQARAAFEPARFAFHA